MKSNLFFLDRKGGVRFIGLFSTKEIIPAITNYVKELNPKYKIPYIRSWQTDDGDMMYDVGSHTEFFKAKPRRN